MNDAQQVIASQPYSVVLDAAPNTISENYSDPGMFVQPTTVLNQLNVSPSSDTPAAASETTPQPDAQWSCNLGGNDCFLNLNGNGSSLFAVNGYNQKLAAYFNSHDHLVLGVGDDWVKFNGGDRAVWTGQHPRKPDWIRLHGHYEAIGLQVSVDIGCGAGVDSGCSTGLHISSSCTCADFSASVPNQWIVDHAFHGYPRFEGTYLTHLDESADSHVKIGYHFFDQGAGSDGADIG